MLKFTYCVFSLTFSPNNSLICSFRHSPRKNKRKESLQSFILTFCPNISSSQCQVASSGVSPAASSSSSVQNPVPSNASSSSLHQPPPLLRPSLPATPSLHRQPPPLQQQARFLQPRTTLQQPPPLIRPSNPMPPRLNPRPTPVSLGSNPGGLVQSSAQQPSGMAIHLSDTVSSSSVH